MGHRGGPPHRPQLLPRTRLPRRDHPPFRTGLRARRRQRLRLRGAGEGLRPGPAGEGRLDQTPRGRHPLGLLPRARHLPRARPRRPGDRLRGAHPAQRQEEPQVLQQPREHPLPQEPLALRHPLRQEGHRRAGHLLPGGGLHRRDQPAPGRDRQHRGQQRHQPHRGAGAADQALHHARHHPLRRRPRRHQGQPARHRPGAAGGPAREGGALPRGRGPRQLRPQPPQQRSGGLPARHRQGLPGVQGRTAGAGHRGRSRAQGRGHPLHRGEHRRDPRPRAALPLRAAMRPPAADRRAGPRERAEQGAAAQVPQGPGRWRGAVRAR